jgi:acyl-CoA thioester hydrolase
MNDDHRGTPGPPEWPHLAGAMDAGGHRLPVRVYYEDTDFSGVVYHASYLRFMERGRTDYLRLLGADHRALFAEQRHSGTGFAFVVRSMQIEFLRPGHMDDILVVHTAPGDVRGASVLLEQRVTRDAELLISASVRVAFVAGGRARRIPDALRAAMTADLGRPVGP